MNGPLIESRFLPLGDYYFGGETVRIQTVLGTCVSITLWHPGRKQGGMCHYLLPERTPHSGTAGEKRGAYATEVMELFAESLRETGTLPRDYVVKLFGGGHMFPEQLSAPECRSRRCTDARRQSCANVGCKNICAGRRLLAERGFVIQAEDVGGHGSRQVHFDVWSGDVWVRQGAPVPGAPIQGRQIIKQIDGAV
jgi:chemotaxis protein CheD